MRKITRRVFTKSVTKLKNKFNFDALICIAVYDDGYQMSAPGFNPVVATPNELDLVVGALLEIANTATQAACEAVGKEGPKLYLELPTGERLEIGGPGGNQEFSYLTKN